jgi:hypothetical protein
MSLEKKIDKLSNIGKEDAQMPNPKITSLEDILPWKYSSWNRLPERCP